MDPPFGHLPITLLDLLSNPIVADNLLQYLSLSSISRLSGAAKAYKDWVLHTPKVFRYLDLSRSKGAYAPNIARIDNGGHSWRAERMDENLTEDEFYAGPLRSVLNRLHRLHVLQDVQVLVLDRLASVTHDLLNEIITDGKYNVRLLSIRQCPNVNSSKLQQLLTYLCRPTRPEGTPRLQGLYYFTNPSFDDLSDQGSSAVADGVTTIDGAALGLLPTDKSAIEKDNAHRWYSPSGQVVSTGGSTRTSWEETLQHCQGIIAFDAVLCTSMHDHMESCLHDASREFLSTTKPGIAPMASIALGGNGCSGCGKAPEGTPVWGENEIKDFPLLAPAPWSGKLVDAVRPPQDIMDGKTKGPPRLVVSCKWCLVNRHCDSCNKWWCSDCYNPKRTNRLRDLEALSDSMLYMPTPKELHAASGTDDEGASGDSIKEHDRHHHYLPIPSGRSAVTRECWDCGRVCAPCASRSARICKRCKSAYCVWHNTGCDEENCDWCQYRGGNNRLRELY